MRCDEWSERLAPYLAGELGDDDRREAEEHLTACNTCLAEVRALKQTWRDLGQLPEYPVPSQRMRRRLREALPARTAGAAGFARPVLLAGAAVIAAAAFLSGFLARGSSPSPVSPPAGPRWVLLLYDRPAAATESQEESRRVVEEYRNWARGLAREGKLLGGEKLVDALSLFTAAGSPAPAAGRARIGGYFVIVAPSPAEAASIARSCPHLARGGTIELRAIDPV